MTESVQFSRPAGQLGIFARTFMRDSPAAVARAVADAGFDLVQLNLNSFGLPTIPDRDLLASTDFGAVRDLFSEQGIAIWGVSVTYNTIHPDAGVRRRLTEAACQLIARVPELGAQFATLCTGTRDAGNMWRSHPANGERSALRDLRATIDRLLEAATDAGVRLGIEPEPANVICDARTAASLLRDLGPDAEHVAIVLDPANLIDPANLVDATRAASQRFVLTEAFETLGMSIECVHAKDVASGSAEGSGHFVAAGAGLLDYDLIFELRSQLPRPVPVVVQDVAEHDARRVRDMLIDQFARHPVRSDAA
ncbi:MAG TPA: TIM barrel protein [Acidothermaceae bacterium]|jgi:sugar phosphate isomerase/epimerase